VHASGTADTVYMSTRDRLPSWLRIVIAVVGIVGVTALAVVGFRADRPQVSAAMAVADMLAVDGVEPSDVSLSEATQAVRSEYRSSVEVGWADGPRGTVLGCARAGGSDFRWVCVSDTHKRAERSDEEVVRFAG
jgi:hypothetical protein